MIKSNSFLTRTLTVAALAVASIAQAPAQASPTGSLNSKGDYRVDSFTLTNLQPYAGRKLSVFYVAGRERSAGRAGQTLKVRRVMRTPITVQISPIGTAIVPSTLVPSRHMVEGVPLVFNYLLLAVHRPGQDRVYLPMDRDGSVPLDPRVPGENDYTGVHPSEVDSQESRFLSLLRYERAVEAKALDGSLSFNYRTDAR